MYKHVLHLSYMQLCSYTTKQEILGIQELQISLFFTNFMQLSLPWKFLKLFIILLYSQQIHKILIFNVKFDGRPTNLKTYFLPHYMAICLHYRKGDLGEFHKHGGMHQYLLHLHQNGHKPINTFWWGQERVVSICSPELFKDTTKLINRPSKELKHLASQLALFSIIT